MQLTIVAFTSLTKPLNKSVTEFSASQDVSLHEITLGENEDSERGRIRKLLDFLNENRLSEQTTALVVEGSSTLLAGTKEDLLKAYGAVEGDILFAADANFHYPEGPLQYYYWKFYPRKGKHYNYLNAGAFMGEVSNLKALLRDIQLAYKLDNHTGIDDPYFTRYYVDVFLEIFSTDYKIVLDLDQRVLAGAGGSLSAVKWPRINWVQDHFLTVHERASKEEDANYSLGKVRGIKKKRSSYYNSRTQTSPNVLAIPAEHFEDVVASKVGGAGKLLTSLWNFLRSIGRMMIVFFVNRFSINPRKTFRFEKHKNPDYEATMQKFLGYLDSGEAFTFAHFNDGELNFIKKFLRGDHKKTWNGRIQDQYDVPLAERLLDSIKYQQKNYFIGVSCSTCGAPRRKVADELMGDYEGKIGAMVFHHNLFYLPKIISNMVNREMYFVMNDYQKLDFLESLGVTVKEENKIKIPFVNSHKEYDNLKDRKFPEGAFVILMCGMLAKVLIRNWYELNPKTTFIALGSTMDDFIQLSNTNYRPYPRKLPLTRNVHLIKSFLFGNKKECKECYNITMG